MQDRVIGFVKNILDNRNYITRSWLKGFSGLLKNSEQKTEIAISDLYVISVQTGVQLTMSYWKTVFAGKTSQLNFEHIRYFFNSLPEKDEKYIITNDLNKKCGENG